MITRFIQGYGALLACPDRFRSGISPKSRVETLRLLQHLGCLRFLGYQSCLDNQA